MHKLRARLAIVFGSSAALAAVGWLAACGGSDAQDVVDDTPDTGVDVNVPDTFRPDTGTGRDAGTDARDSGPTFNPGDAATLDGGELYEGGVACVQGGILEQEPDNDDPTTATRVNPEDAGCTWPSPGCSVCGVVFQNDGADAGVEDDHVMFELHNAAKEFWLEFGGDVTLHVDVDGADAGAINRDSSPKLPFKKDGKYTVLVRPNVVKPRTPWRVTLYERY